MRDHCTDEEREAHRVLDHAKSGLEVPPSMIAWALLVLGDGVGLVHV